MRDIVPDRPGRPDRPGYLAEALGPVVRLG